MASEVGVCRRKIRFHRTFSPRFRRLFLIPISSARSSTRLILVVGRLDLRKGRTHHGQSREVYGEHHGFTRPEYLLPIVDVPSTAHAFGQFRAPPLNWAHCTLYRHHISVHCMLFENRCIYYRIHTAMSQRVHTCLVRCGFVPVVSPTLNTKAS